MWLLKKFRADLRERDAGNFEKKLISCGNMFCVLVKYQDLNVLLVLIKMFRAWFLVLSVEEISTISAT